jgi:hypothetical protein
MFDQSMHALQNQFDAALTLINVADDRRQHAIDAHTEIRELLEEDEQLCAWGVDTILIGSYARHTGIHPGKDVDVFTKLASLTVDDVEPATIFEHVRDLLVEAYGDRAKPQARSVTVNFDREGFEFSVDAVPAVHMGDRWAIPRHDTALWDDPDERWVETDPEKLKTLTEERNTDLTVGGQGAYVPVVKLVRQARRHHRGAAKPGGFYFELMTYWAFERGEVSGTTFAEILADTLESIAAQLANGVNLTDPVLERDYMPLPEPSDRSAAAATFAELARKAREAVNEDSCCRAAALWREILGENEQDWCFPVPDGCDEQGRTLSVTGVSSSRGSREPGGFA